MFRRHDLVWLSEAGWQSAADAVQASDLPLVAQWRRRGWPLIVRRADKNADRDTLSIGLAAPPCADSGQKQRLALRVKRADVKHVAPPLPLAEAGAHAPEAWRRSLSELARRSDELGMGFRVYGSLAMQAITGMQYLRDSSDIDLLGRPRNRAELDRMIALLGNYKVSLPIDGEIDFPDGRAVSWKEWAAARASGDGAMRVLVKHFQAVELARVDAMLAAFEGGHG